MKNLVCKVFGIKNENSYRILIKYYKLNNPVNLQYKNIKLPLKNTFTTDMPISYFIINYTYSYKNIIDIYYIKYMSKVMVYFTNNRMIRILFQYIINRLMLLKKQYSILLKSLREVLLERRRRYE
jgi:hypothetical protein